MAEPSASTAVPTLPSPLACDLFCRVIDNFGDAGVTWRLARLLKARFAAEVRIFIDDEAPLRFMASSPSDIAILPWSQGDHVEPADHLVIELFACDLPAAYVGRMALRARPPVWLNLEYLSAEPWVEACHRLPSPHAGSGLDKYFYFPGFTAGTGGLLVDAALPVRPSVPPSNETPAPCPTCFIYCYETPAIADWMRHLVRTDTEWALVLAPGAAQTLWDGVAAVHGPGRCRVTRLAYVPQDTFDATLWAADWAIVRGEDSFVQAQLGAVPLVWDIYPQAEDAHVVKRTAWQARYVSEMPAALAAPWGAFQSAIAGTGAVGPAWDALAPHLAAWRTHAFAWATTLRHHDFASRLAQFLAEKLK